MRPAGIPKTSGILPRRKKKIYILLLLLLLIFLPRRIFVFLGLSHNLLVITIVYVYGYYGLPSSGNGISLTFHLLARADCRESLSLGDRSQGCQSHDNYPPNTTILSLWYVTLPFKIWQHLAPADLYICSHA